MSAAAVLDIIIFIGWMVKTEFLDLNCGIIFTGFQTFRFFYLSNSGLIIYWAHNDHKENGVDPNGLINYSNGLIMFMIMGLIVMGLTIQWALMIIMMMGLIIMDS